MLHPVNQGFIALPDPGEGNVGAERTTLPGKSQGCKNLINLTGKVCALTPVLHDSPDDTGLDPAVTPDAGDCEVKRSSMDTPDERNYLGQPLFRNLPQEFYGYMGGGGCDQRESRISPPQVPLQSPDPVPDILRKVERKEGANH